MSKNTNLSFLTDYITADITNGRIGINNASPTVAFDVVGATKITGVLTLTSTISNGTYAYTLPSATGTLALTSSLSSYVPYTGASASVDLGTFDLTGRYLVSAGASALGGVVSMRQDAAYIPKGDGYSSIASSFVLFDFRGYTGASTYKNFALRFDGLTDNTQRIYTLPDATGTLALTSSLSGYLPLTGGTLTGALSGTTASFSGLVTLNSNEPLILNRTNNTSTSNAIRFQTGGTTQWYVGSDSYLQSGTENFGFYNGSYKLTITSAGNVGIGTTSPTGFSDRILNIFGSASSELHLTTTGSGTLQSDGLSIGLRDSDGSAQFILRDASFMALGTSDSERMRINSAGRVIIGGTTAGTSLNDSLTVNSASAGNYSGLICMTADTSRGYYGGTSVGLEIGVSGTGYLTMFTNGSERMRITSGGQVLINTTTTTTGGVYHPLIVKGTSTASQGIWVEAYSNDCAIYLDQRSTVGAIGTSYRSSGGYTPLIFETSGSERMRITSGGDAFFGTTSNSGNATGGSTNVGVIIEGANGAITTQRNNSANIFCSKASGFTDGTLIHFFTQGINRGSITTNGVNTAYNTSSDYRLKEDLKDYNGLNIISKLKTYDFKWKDTNIRDYGVMAHELQEVLPNYVNGDKDGKDMQGVDYSKLVPVLVKAIQELSAENTSLINRIEALENK